MSLATVPNLLSVSRIVIGVFIVFSLDNIPLFWLLLTFAMAVLSDIFDGWLARSQAQDSPIGTLIDHTSDAVFVTIITSRLAFDGLVPWLLPILICVSFLQYAFDYRILRLPSFRSSRIGRLNGIAYYVVSGVGILLFSASQSVLFEKIFYYSAVVLIITTLCSMAERAFVVLQKQQRSMLRK